MQCLHDIRNLFEQWSVIPTTIDELGKLLPSSVTVTERENAMARIEVLKNAISLQDMETQQQQIQEQIQLAAEKLTQAHDLLGDSMAAVKEAVENKIRGIFSDDKFDHVAKKKAFGEFELGAVLQKVYN